MKLDIMLPYWGSPDYLFETVESVLHQDSDAWRLVVVDDRYPDERVPEYFAKVDDPRVTYVRNEVNLGITANYERCLELVESEYMMFLGCDDVMHPNYVSSILTAIAKYPNIDIIQPAVQPIDEKSAPVKTLGDTIKDVLRPSTRRGPRIISGESAAATLLTGDWLYWPSLTFRTQSLRDTPFRDSFPLIQDLAVVVDILAAGGRILVEPTLCFSYRRHESSASGSKLMDGTRFAGERRYFDLAREAMLANGWTRAARAARLHGTSRLYAASLLPKAVRTRDGAAVKSLFKHIFATQG